MVENEVYSDKIDYSKIREFTLPTDPYDTPENTGVTTIELQSSFQEKLLDLFSLARASSGRGSLNDSQQL